MLKRTHYAVLTACLLTFAAAAGYGETVDRVCDPQALAKAHKPNAYRWFAAEKTCEGLYDKPRRTQLDLVSLTRGKLHFDLESDNVEIHAPTGALINGPIHVRGFGLASTLRVDGQTLAYQLDSTVAVGGSRPWPMERVLRPRQLGVSDIGLVAWFEDDAGPVYVPVEVRQGAVAARPQTPILITVRVPGYTDWVKACIQEVQTIDLETGEATVLPSCEWRSFDSRIPAGGTVEIPLPTGSEGLLSIAVRAKVGPQVFPLHMDVYRPTGW